MRRESNAEWHLGQHFRNGKVAKALEIIDKMEVDLSAFNEHKVNFIHQDYRRNGLGALFHRGKILTKAIGGNISDPGAQLLGCHMEGGTGIVAYEELVNLLTVWDGQYWSGTMDIHDILW